MADRYENTFVREVKEKNITKPEDILNWYRNLYHTEDNHTEHGIMAYAINDYFADVVPKSEVEEIVRQWKEEANCWQNNYIAELRANEQIKAEVAREIFAEIYEDCFDQFGYINYEALAELKKKYTEN